MITEFISMSPPLQPLYWGTDLQNKGCALYVQLHISSAHLIGQYNKILTKQKFYSSAVLLANIKALTRAHIYNEK